MRDKKAFIEEALVQRKRDEFEKALQLNRRDLRQWIRYAHLETNNKQIDRARSIYERALSVDYTSSMLWESYANFESHNSRDQAVSVLKRAVELLPRNDNLWAKYAQYAQDSDVYKQWSINSPNAFLNWYKFDRQILKYWIETVGCEEWAKQAMVYPNKLKQDLKNAVNDSDLPQKQKQTILKSLVPDIIKPDTLEDAIRSNGTDVALWWATLNNQLHEDILQKAVELCIPAPSPTKTLQWRMYALLWLRYAVFQELRGGNCLELYEKALSHWDHAKFTSCTLWKQYARCYIRQGNLSMSRKVFGTALGRTKNTPAYLNILTDYIDLETEIGDKFRCRKLYRMLCLANPQSHKVWLSWAEYEMQCDETERCIFLLKTVLKQDFKLDNRDPIYYMLAEVQGPLSLAKAREEWEDAILHGTVLYDVYMQYAMYELSIGWDDAEGKPDQPSINRARAIFQRGLAKLEGSNKDNLQEYYTQFTDLYGDNAEEMTPMQKLLAKAKQWSESK